MGVTASVLGRDQLEVLPPDHLTPDHLTTADPPPPVKVRRHRRWWWLVPVIAVVALAIAFPVRAVVGRAELRRLESRWRVSQQVITDGFEQITTLRTAAGPSFASVIPAVFREQADDVQRELMAARGEWVLDPSLVPLRRRIARGLAQEVIDLRRDAQYGQRPDGSPEPPYLSAQTSDARAAVERALAAQLQRFSLQPDRPRRVPRLKAVRAGLTQLSHVTDQPIGARLVIGTAAGLFKVDIDANRVEPVLPERAPSLQVLQLLPRAGVVVIRAVGPYGPDSSVDEMYVAPATFAGPLTDLGTIDALVPGERPDTFWVRRPDGTAVELDAAFRVVRGPVALPYSSFLVGGTASGLVIAIRPPSGRSFPLEIIDPAQPAGLGRVVGSGVPLTACGDRVIWFENGDQAVVHVTDVVSGGDHTIEPGPGVWPDGVWACSPDNTLVAGAWFSLADKPVDVPGVIDLRTGMVMLTTGGSLDSQPGTTGTAWTYAGDRLFFVGTASSGGGQDPMTFRPGDSSVLHLRLPGYQVNAVVPLP